MGWNLSLPNLSSKNNLHNYITSNARYSPNFFSKRLLFNKFCPTPIIKETLTVTFTMINGESWFLHYCYWVRLRVFVRLVGCYVWSLGWFFFFFFFWNGGGGFSFLFVGHRWWWIWILEEVGLVEISGVWVCEHLCILVIWPWVFLFGWVCGGWFVVVVEFVTVVVRRWLGLHNWIYGLWWVLCLFLCDLGLNLWHES